MLVAVDIFMDRLRVKWSTEYEQDIARELLGMLRSYYIPILGRLARCANGRPLKGEALAKVESNVLSAAHNICGPRVNGIRAVLFEVSRGTLRPKEGAYEGGERPTHRKFSRTSDRVCDRHAWEVAATGEPRIYRDVTKDPPPGFQKQGSNYATFMTCGVLDADQKVVGMLNVDGPVAGTLSDPDAVILKLLCETLSLAYDVNKGGAQ